MTRLVICSSILSSFSRSPSIMRSTGMPVQRDTTPAIWLAVTASSASTVPAALCFSASASLLLELRDAVVLQFAGTLIIAAPRRFGELVLQLVELLLQVGGLAELVLLGLPLRGQRVGLLFQIGQFLGRAASAAPWSPRRSPCAAPPARSSAARSRGRDCRVPRAWNRSACAAAPPPRRPGRSPCRAGSGR